MYSTHWGGGGLNTRRKLHKKGSIWFSIKENNLNTFSLVFKWRFLVCYSPLFKIICSTVVFLTECIHAQNLADSSYQQNVHYEKTNWENLNFNEYSLELKVIYQLNMTFTCSLNFQFYPESFFNSVNKLYWLVSKLDCYSLR